MYTQSITRRHRTAFVIALDQSTSMAGRVMFQQEEISKAEAVAEITNRLLFELIERARRQTGVCDYYDVAVIGYSGDGICSMLPTDHALVSIKELAAIGVPTIARTVQRTLSDGQTTQRTLSLPAWVEAKSTGGTPMFEALREVREMLTEWCGQPQNRQSFPPVVFNISDGEASDCDERELEWACDEIKKLRTEDGHVLLINIHIAASESSRTLLFPTESELGYGNRYATLLYNCSSVMPVEFNVSIRRARGDHAAPPFRGMSYNASLSELVAVLNIGSISVRLQ